MMRMISMLLAGMMLLSGASDVKGRMPQWQEKAQEYLESWFAGREEKARGYMELLLEGEYERFAAHLSDEMGDVTADTLKNLMSMNSMGEVESIELAQCTYTWGYFVFSYEVKQGGREYIYSLSLNGAGEIAGLNMRRMAESMPTAVPAERELDWQAIAREQLELWLAGEYDQLIEQMDENVMTGVTVETLIWLTDTYGGEAQEYALYREAEVEGYHQVQYDVKHSNGRSIYSIALNGNGKIAGVGITPMQAQNAPDAASEEAGQ